MRYPGEQGGDLHHLLVLKSQWCVASVVASVVAGALMSLVFLSGIAIGAFAALLAALVGLYLLLSEVFGVSLELNALPR